MTISRLPIGTSTLGTASPLTVSALGLGCMGMSEFYGTGDEQRRIDTIHRALDLGVTFLDTADMYGPFTNEQLVGKAIAGRRDEVQLATKFGNERLPDGTRVGINGTPGLRPLRLRRVAAAARRGPHRPLLPAPRRQDRPDRGDRRRDEGARRGRQGPPPRALRGVARRPSAGRTPCTRSPRCRPSTRCSPATSRTRSSRPSAELGIGLVPYSPLGRGLLTGAITQDAGADGESGLAAARRTSRASRARPSTPTSRWSTRSARSPTTRAARPASSRSPGCWRRATTSAPDPRHQARDVPRGERRRRRRSS